jgi:hypothetical protein
MFISSFFLVVLKYINMHFSFLYQHVRIHMMSTTCFEMFQIIWKYYFYIMYIEAYRFWWIYSFSFLNMWFLLISRFIIGGLCQITRRSFHISLWKEKSWITVLELIFRFSHDRVFDFGISVRLRLLHHFYC